MLPISLLRATLSVWYILSMCVYMCVYMLAQALLSVTKLVWQSNLVLGQPCDIELLVTHL